MSRLTPEEKRDWVDRIRLGEYEDNALVQLVRENLIEAEDLDFFHEREWSILDVVYGRNRVSEIESEAEEESRRIQEIFDEWNAKLGGEAFGEHLIKD